MKNVKRNFYFHHFVYKISIFCIIAIPTNNKVRSPLNLLQKKAKKKSTPTSMRQQK